MYPRNAAAPEPIAIGAVIQISDGAVQTSGCTVRIKPIGVAEADGGGTPAYSTDGIVLYTPTQAETNYTSFVLIAKKTGCIPVSITIVTSAESVPGTVSANVTKISGDSVAADNAEAFFDGTGYAGTNNTIPTVTTVTTTTNLTNLPSIPANWITAAGIDADAVTEIQAGLSTLTQANIRTAVGMASANLDTQIGLLATAANLLIVSDGVGFITAVLMGACSDAGTAAETYVITFGGATYTADFTGLDTTGNRTTTTRTKT